MNKHLHRKDRASVRVRAYTKILSQGIDIDCSWDMDVCVYSGSQSSSFRRQHAGALWLRAIASHYQQHSADELPDAPREQIVFENQISHVESADACGGAAQWRTKNAHLKIRRNAARQEQYGGDRDFSCLVLELWGVEACSNVDSNDENDGFLSFIGAARVDLKRWKQASAPCPTRWYTLQSGRSAKREAWGTESEFEEHEERLLPEAVYFRAALVDSSTTKKKTKKTSEAKAEPPSSSPSLTINNEFQFVIPSQTIARNRRFLATCVGEIVHEGNTEYLRELLPVVLYGKAQLRCTHVELPMSRQQQECYCLNKGLQLLQLSCQYACYCTTKLSDNARFEKAQSWDLSIALALQNLNCTTCMYAPHQKDRVETVKAHAAQSQFAETKRETAAAPLQFTPRTAGSRQRTRRHAATAAASGSQLPRTLAARPVSQNAKLVVPG